MFTTDSRTEHYLNSCGVKYEYREDVTYDELKADWNNTNWGRPGNEARIPVAIETYADMMLDGSPAPAIVTHKTRDGLDVLDGVQRLNANSMCDHTKFCAYIVSCSDETALKIRICINNRLAGVAQNPADFAIEQMVEWFMIKGNETAADVAQFVGRTKTDVEKYYQRSIAKHRIDSLYGDGSHAPKMKLEVYDRLAEVSDPSDFDGKAGDQVRKFIDVLDKCRFPNGDASRLTAEFFNIRRVGNKKRDVQLKSKLREIYSDPIVKSKLMGRRVSTSLERMHRHFKTLHNSVKAHKGQEIDNAEYIESFDHMHSEIGRMLREQCTTEIRHKINPFVKH